MEDKKIVKALECCSVHPMKCKECSYQGMECCTNQHRKDALDLINRLQAEKEMLNKEIADREMSHINLYNEFKAEIEKSNALIAEIDELKNGYFQKRYEEEECKELQSVRKAWEKASNAYIDLNAEWEGKYKTAKSEAYQEFANKMNSIFAEIENKLPKNKIVKQTLQVYKNIIQIAKKELVGEDNEMQN